MVVEQASNFCYYHYQSMGEKSPSPDLRAYSRRDALRFLAAGLTVAGVKKLEQGVRLNPPPLDPKPITFGPDVIAAINYAQMNETQRMNTESRLLVGSGYKIFGEPEIMTAHRSGNSIGEINTAYEKGTRVFDIDTLSFKGNLYAEHGFIPTFKLFGLEVGLPVVIDPNEEEYYMGRPIKLKKIIEHVGKLSDPHKALGVSMELKRGEYDSGIMNRLFDVLESEKVPAVINTRNQNVMKLATNVLSERNSLVWTVGQIQAA